MIRIFKIFFAIGAFYGLVLFSFCSPMNDRVQAARDSIGVKLETAVQDFGAKPGSDIFIRAFKEDKEMELWMKKDSVFHLFKTYEICLVPGNLGPKRREGDWQVPEGVYRVDKFNPKSKFHLSLGINYPNESDLRFANKEQPGGEVFIHGKCVSVGCIPIQDSNIEEVYLLALDAINSGQEYIPVHIFPCRMDDMSLGKLITADFSNRSFWENLQPVYQFFERKRTVPEVIVNVEGRYEVK